MSYSYHNDNFPEEKINYMYSPFEGKSLLKKHRDHRMSALQVHGSKTVQNGGLIDTYTASALKVLEMELEQESEDRNEMFRSLLGSVNLLRQKSEEPLEPLFSVEVERLKRFSIQEDVDSWQLVQSVTAALISGGNRENVKKWLDLLVQRFEVTGKLYEGYEAGFRKGKATAENIRIYWFCSLAICLYYARYKEIKYVSTLLKLNDCLCSLSDERLKGQISNVGLSIILAAEIVFVEKLVNKGGIVNAFT